LVLKCILVDVSYKSTVSYGTRYLDPKGGMTVALAKHTWKSNTASNIRFQIADHTQARETEKSGKGARQAFALPERSPLWQKVKKS
jgi:hypothetical protein